VVVCVFAYHLGQQLVVVLLLLLLRVDVGPLLLELALQLFERLELLVLGALDR
jgi:hypothetical protein